MRSLPRRVLRRVRRILGELANGPRRIQARRLAATGLVDRSWYERQTGRAFRNGSAAARHYLASGRAAGMSPHVLVEPEWIAGGAWRGRVDPLQQYLGGHALRGGPSPVFDDAGYAAGHADAAGGKGRALRHFVRASGPQTSLPVPAAVAAMTLGELRTRLEAVVDDRAGAGEPASPGEVVTTGDPVDWTALDEGVADRDPALTSLVVSVSNDWSAAMSLIDRALRGAADGSIEVVVVDRGSRAAVARLLAARYGGDPRVSYLRQPTDLRVAPAWTLGLARTAGSVVVLVDSTCQLRDSGAPLDRPWWQPLRAALDDPTVAAVAPLVLGATGTVSSAGLATRGPGASPYPLFVDAAAEDVVRGGPLRVGALGDDVLVARASDLVAARGPDPWYVAGLWGADLSVRLAGGDRTLLVVPQVRLVHLAASAAPSQAELAGFQDRVGSLLPGADVWGEVPAWERAGVAPTSAEHASPGVAVTRRVRPVEVGPAAGKPALRWALKIGAPFHEQGDKWGDVHFASDLAAALERLGQLVAVDRLPAHQRSTAGLDDVVLNLRGLTTPALSSGPVNILWVISHPDDVTPDEVRSYDLTFAASGPWSELMTGRAGVPVEALLQATDPSRFHPDLAVPGSGPAALFVGNSRGVQRPVVRDAVAAGVDVAIYGTRWKDFVDERYVRGDYLPNETVGAAYRAAGVVLNDHWPDMAAQGFVSNRVFDVVAAGGRVISDHVEGLEEIFGGAVRVYRTPDDLASWTGAGRALAFPDEEQLLEISARIRRDHSFDARAAQLLAAVLAVIEREPTARAG